MKVLFTGDSVGQFLAAALADSFNAVYAPPRMDMLYPNIAAHACGRLLDGDCDRLVLVCGTGLGMSIAANKQRGIMAALCHDTYSARKAVTSNNSNVLCLGARVIGIELAKDIVTTWLTAEYDRKGPSAANVAALENLDRI